METGFHHIETWIFDLDNTLYPPKVRLFDQIEIKMTAFVMDSLGVDKPTANRLRREYWEEYGTTLAGLMDIHGIDPGPYLHDVHQISFDALEPEPELARVLKSLPGRKIIYTNGTAPYARNVAAARGILDEFCAVYGVEHANFRPKPERVAFEAIALKDGFNPATSAMFEDDPRNLLAPKKMGMRTIHVAPEQINAPHIEHHTDDLTNFLSQVRDQVAPL